MSQQTLQLTFDHTLVQGSIKKAMSVAEAKSRDLWQVPIDSIHVIDNFNVRTRNQALFEHIRKLADLMKVEGYKQDKPLAGYVAKKDGADVIYIYDGHNRLQAARLARSEGAELDVLPVVISGFGHSLEDLTVDLVTGNNGLPLTVFETAIVCKRLLGYNWEVSQIAQRLGFTQTYVNDLLFLIAAPIQIRDMVQNDQVAATKAIEVLRKYGEKAVDVLQNSLQKAQNAGKTKITDRFTPGAVLKRVVKKNTPEMLNTLNVVKSDPGFASLSEETQQKLTMLLDIFKQAEEHENALLAKQDNESNAEQQQQNPEQ